MLKRFGLALGLLAIFFLLAAPMIVTAEEEAYAEGIHFEKRIGGPQGGHYAIVTATKRVDGTWRETMVEFRFWSGTKWGATHDIEAAAVLVEDPDGLDVSEDLGWGGLEGQIAVFDRADGQYHTIEFHVTQPANEGTYWEDPATWYFMRSANVEGYILLDGNLLTDLDTTSGVTETAYNFSDQWPGY